MPQHRENIVKAAFEVFSRYGMKRATMGDIAEEAGVARQTLYNQFADKDDLLRAAIRLHADTSLAAIESECEELNDLGDKLDVVFQRIVVVPWDRLHATPHGNEILTGFREAARQEIGVSDRRFGAMLETLLAPSATGFSHAGLTVRQACDLIQASWYGIRHKARDRDHLLELLASLKTLVLHASEAR